VTLAAFGTVEFGPADCKPAAPGGRLFGGWGSELLASGAAGDMPDTKGAPPTWALQPATESRLSNANTLRNNGTSPRNDRRGAEGGARPPSIHQTAVDQAIWLSANS
jgi:hypothetical protein